MARRRIETVLLDVDGTLVDSNGAHTQSWTQALVEHGVSVLPIEVRRLIGMGSDKLLPAVAHVEDHSELGKAIIKRKKELFDTLLPDLAPTPGARPLLEHLLRQGIALVVATSGDDREVGALLKRAGVEDLIPARTSKDEAPDSKPAPDVVEAALAKSRARPAFSLLVGDTPYDIEAATRAGIASIALRCGGYWSDDALRGATEIYDNPAALLRSWDASIDSNRT